MEDTRTGAEGVRTDQQRRSRRRPARQLGTWVVVATAFTWFATSVAAGAGVVGHPDWKGAMQGLERDGHSGDDRYVVVEDDHGSGFGEREHQVCSVSPATLAALQARFTTGTVTVQRDGHTVTLVTVAGATRAELQALVGSAQVHCHLAQRHGIFFLPFDAGLS